jgi:hypothetical protein
VVKYCYVLLEHIADGAQEPPVMSTDMLSPFEIRRGCRSPFIIAARCVRGRSAARGPGARRAVLPAARVDRRRSAWASRSTRRQPVMLLRVVRGLGPYYLVILRRRSRCTRLLSLLRSLDVWNRCSMPRACSRDLVLRTDRRLPVIRATSSASSPAAARSAPRARAEAERVKCARRCWTTCSSRRASASSVDATRPLATWLSALDGEPMRAMRVRGRAGLAWQLPPGLNTIGSTLIRHLLRAGRPDGAAGIRTSARTGARVDDGLADDLRTLMRLRRGRGQGELAHLHAAGNADFPARARLTRM